MPYYDFKCTKKSCGNVEEKEYSMAKVPDTTKCPFCKSKSKRMFSSGVAIQVNNSPAGKWKKGITLDTK